MTLEKYELERERLTALADGHELSYWDAESAIAANWLKLSPEDQKAALALERERQSA